jgi:hypothetical protein
MAKGREENLIQLVRAFETEHPGEVWTTRDVIEWAMATGLMDEPDPQLLREQEIQQRTKELGDAARKEHHRDPDGLRVRSFYCTTVQRQDENGKLTQQGLWSSREMASWEFKARAVDQRYQQVLGDAVALNTDVISLNRHDRPAGRPEIQLNWDLTDAFRGDDDLSEAG